MRLGWRHSSLQMSQQLVPVSAFPCRHRSSAIWGFQHLSQQVHRERLGSEGSSANRIGDLGGWGHGAVVESGSQEDLEFLIPSTTGVCATTPGLCCAGFFRASTSALTPESHPQHLLKDIEGMAFVRQGIACCCFQ